MGLPEKKISSSAVNFIFELYFYSILFNVLLLQTPSAISVKKKKMQHKGYPMEKYQLFILFFSFNELIVNMAETCLKLYTL